MPPSDFDRVDVIIPCWTETTDHLQEALASLRSYMRPIVTFNGPGAPDVAQDWWDAQAIRGITNHLSDDYIETLGSGCYLCHARNDGLRTATSEYVAYLDADDLFLPGIDDVVLAARGRRGAWGQMLVASADRERVVMQEAAPPDGLPHTGTFVLRRDVAPIFDVWAPHQVTNRGPLYNAKWWREITALDLKYVLAQAMVYRWDWSPTQATKRYRDGEGFIGVGDRDARLR